MIKQVLLLLFISQQLLTFHPGIYECKDQQDYYKLVLNEDSTYQYSSSTLQKISSTIIPKIILNGRKVKHVKDTAYYYQYAESGKWKYYNDTLFLMDSITQFYNKSGVVGEYIIEQNYVSVKVIDGQNKPYSDIMVGLNYRKPWKKTDSAGIVRFEYKEIKKYPYSREDTMIGLHVLDTVLSFGLDTNTGLLKFKFYGKKKKSIEDISIVAIQIKKSDKLKKEECLNSFNNDYTDNFNEHANHFVVTQDFNTIVKKVIRIRKLPIVDNLIILKNPTFRNDGHTIKLANIR